MTTRTGEKVIANPEEFQVEEDTMQKNGCKTQGVKAWKNLKNRFKRDNQTKGASDRSKIREERDNYGMPITGTFVKPGRETIASHTNSTPKDKNETHGKEASRKDAGRQTPRHGPQLREAPGPKRKNMPPAEMTMTREPHIAKAPPAAQVHQQGKEHATETRTTHPHPKDEDRNTIRRRPRQEDAQNPVHNTRTE